jgi:NAD(P)-dependent dehydrogenase (short-subunit alcohol dehydrogenase family)
MDMLRANVPSRVINTSSGSHYSGKINFSNIHLKYQYFVYNAYSQSKLANVMFTYALARKLEGSGVTVNCMHPGLVRTGIFRKVVGRTLEKIFIRNAIPVEEGAETLVYLASARDLVYENGSYYYKKKARTTSERSYNVDAQDRLWSMSEEMLKPWLQPELLGD